MQLFVIRFQLVRKLLTLQKIKDMKKQISLKEAISTYDEIKSKYIAPRFKGKPMIELPNIDMKKIFGDRERMNVDKLLEEINRIIDGL